MVSAQQSNDTEPQVLEIQGQSKPTLWNNMHIVFQVATFGGVLVPNTDGTMAPNSLNSLNKTDNSYDTWAIEIHTFTVLTGTFGINNMDVFKGTWE